MVNLNHNFFLFGDILLDGIPAAIFIAGIIVTLYKHRRPLSVKNLFGIGQDSVTKCLDIFILWTIILLNLLLWNSFSKGLKTGLWNYWNKVECKKTAKGYHLIDTIWSWVWWTIAYKESGLPSTYCKDPPFPLDPDLLAWLACSVVASVIFFLAVCDQSYARKLFSYITEALKFGGDDVKRYLASSDAPSRTKLMKEKENSMTESDKTVVEEVTD